MDLFDLKGISIGDWVVSSQMAGYWLVKDIKESYHDRKPNGYILILKRGFNSKMAFLNGTDWCHVYWCNKVSCEKLDEINRLFSENPLKRKKFEAYPMNIAPAIQTWFLSCGVEQIEEFQKGISVLGKRFTEKQFNECVQKIGLRKYMKNYSNDHKYVLRIHCFIWEVDENLNQLLFDPTIEKA